MNPPIHDQTHSKPDQHQAFSVMEQENVSTMNDHTENKSPSSQNPFESPSNAMNKKPEDDNPQGLSDSENLALNPSQNPFLMPEPQISSTSDQQIVAPSPSSPPSAVPREDGNSNPKSSSYTRSASNGSDSDFPISSMPSTQNPPVQVMERAEEPDTPSAYRIPSHVFDRTKSNAPEWSTASNESLFSIHMGNMSFSRELNWLNSEMNMSGPLPPLNSEMNMSGPLPPLNSDNNNGGLTSNQSPVTKFNDISQSAGEFRDGDAVTEAKAAETMREVIMETTEDYDLTSVSVKSRVDGPSIHDQSRHSDGSTKSFAFKVMTEGEKSPSRSSKHVKERPLQQIQSEKVTPIEPPKTSQAPKPTPNNASCKWLCCFTFCIK